MKHNPTAARADAQARSRSPSAAPNPANLALAKDKKKEAFALGRAPSYLKTGERAAYRALVEHVNMKTGECWPSKETIAERLGCDVSTADRLVDKLAEWKIVIAERVPRPKGHRNNCSNRYTIALEPLRAQVEARKVGMTRGEFRAKYLGLEAEVIPAESRGATPAKSWRGTPAKCHPIGSGGMGSYEKVQSAASLIQDEARARSPSTYPEQPPETVSNLSPNDAVEGASADAMPSGPVAQPGVETPPPPEPSADLERGAAAGPPAGFDGAMATPPGPTPKRPPCPRQTPAWSSPGSRPKSPLTNARGGAAGSVAPAFGNYSPLGRSPRERGVALGPGGSGHERRAVWKAFRWFCHQHKLSRPKRRDVDGKLFAPEQAALERFVAEAHRRAGGDIDKFNSIVHHALGRFFGAKLGSNPCRLFDTPDLWGDEALAAEAARAARQHRYAESLRVEARAPVPPGLLAMLESVAAQSASGEASP